MKYHKPNPQLYWGDNINSLRSVFFLFFLLISFISYSQQQPFNGSLLYISTHPASLSVDTTRVYFSADKILLTYSPGDTVRSAYKRLADLKTGKQYWMNEQHTIALVESIRDERKLRNFERLPGKARIQGRECRVYFSDIVILGKEEKEHYTHKLWVGDTMLVNSSRPDLYLAGFGIYDGKLIIKKENEYIPDINKMESIKTTLILMETKTEELPAEFFVIPAHFRQEKFTQPKFFEYITHEDVDGILLLTGI